MGLAEAVPCKCVASPPPAHSQLKEPGCRQQQQLQLHCLPLRNTSADRLLLAEASALYQPMPALLTRMP